MKNAAPPLDHRDRCVASDRSIAVAPGGVLDPILGALIAMRLRTPSKIPRCEPVLRRARGLQR